MPATGGTTQGPTTAHQKLMKLTGSLERLKAQRDILEEEIERDIKLLKDRWDIEDVESALDSIKSIQDAAQEAANKRDNAITDAERVMAQFTE